MTYPEDTGSVRGEVAIGLAYWALHLVPAGVLVSALDPWPSAYYTGLRIVVSLAAAALAIHLYRRDRIVEPWTLAFGATAVFFNPVIPISISTDTWATYIAVAMLFVVHLVVTRTPDGSGTLAKDNSLD